MNRIKLFTLVAMAAAVFSSGGARAATILGLFDTGVDAAGVALVGGDGVIDPHYTIVSSTSGASFAGKPAVTFRASPYAANDGASRWVSLSATGLPGGNTTIYRTSFDLTGLDPATAVISGDWGVDNQGSILLNGLATGVQLTGVVSQNFSQLHAFTIGSGFLPGLNTLDIRVIDNGGETAFRVDHLTGSAAALPPSPGVPEPAAWALMLAGFGGVGAMLRRRRTLRAAALLTAAALALTAAPASAAGLVLINQNLNATIRYEYLLGFASLGERTISAALPGGIVAVSNVVNSFDSGLPIGEVGAVQTGAGSSALSLNFLNTEDQGLGSLTARTAYDFTVRNEASTPQPLSFNFRINPGMLEVDTPSATAGTEGVTAQFAINVARGFDQSNLEPTGPFRWAASLAVNNAIATAVVQAGGPTVMMPDGAITSGPVHRTNLIGGPSVTALSWDQFDGSIPFADLQPGEFFELTYFVDLFTTAASITPGEAVFGSAGDPAELESGSPNGAGGMFQLISGNQIFPAAQTGVPEPGAWALMTCGFAGLGLAVRRRRKLSLA